MHLKDLRVCFIGNYPPRKCGIASFTADLADAVASHGVDVEIIAMDDGKESYDFGESVVESIPEGNAQAYRDAADRINAKRYDLICLQHEYGIFGGPAGSLILDLVKRLNPPVVVTLHTVLTDPPVANRDVMDELLAYAEKVVVMSPKGASILQDVHRSQSEKIAVVPHGVPDFPFEQRKQLRTKLGFENRDVLMTFGFLAPDKGIEYVIRAMPEIVRYRPNAQYAVVGQTHPNIRAAWGETYRQSLQDLVIELGITDYVRFIDRYVALDELTELLVAADIYVTPYLKKEQITSGTLAYAAGAGKSIVSTSYWHAEELLADGAGDLVPTKDSGALASAITRLLSDPILKQSRESCMLQRAQSMRWEKVGETYRGLFDEVLQNSMSSLTNLELDDASNNKNSIVLPTLSLEHLSTLTDDVGIVQHATYDVPNRHEGYCTDDNARALIVATNLISDTEATPILVSLEGRYLSFIQHAWNPETKQFRNFLDYSRRWIEFAGSHDSFGRALWALGHTATKGSNAGRRSLARELFLTATQRPPDTPHLRSAAFAVLGIGAYLRGYPNDSRLLDELERLAEILLRSFMENASETWIWFEDHLSYDNARIPQALIVAGIHTGVEKYVNVGCMALRWLTQVQTAPDGCFSPVGCSERYCRGESLPHFDQQPLEAAAQIDACVHAYESSASNLWLREAERAMGWYLGANDLKAPIANVKNGGCRDGLTPNGVNANMGAESTLAYVSSLHAMKRMQSYERALDNRGSLK